MLKLIRWTASTILFGLLFEVASPLVGWFLKPEPWYVEALGAVLLLAAVAAWGVANYWLGKIVAGLSG